MNDLWKPSNLPIWAFRVFILKFFLAAALLTFELSLFWFTFRVVLLLSLSIFELVSKFRVSIYKIGFTINLRSKSKLFVRVRISFCIELLVSLCWFWFKISKLLFILELDFRINDFAIPIMSFIKIIYFKTSMVLFFLSSWV